MGNLDELDALIQDEILTHVLADFNTQPRLRYLLHWCAMHTKRSDYRYT